MSITNGTLENLDTGEERRVYGLEGDLYPDSAHTSDRDLIASYVCDLEDENGNEVSYEVIGRNDLSLRFDE